MMELDLPAVCGLAAVEDAVERAVGQPHEALFADSRTEWLERVQQYMDERGDPSTVGSWPLATANGDVFRDLYDKASTRSVSGRFIHDLKEHELALCPACGNHGRPGTRDHYLPQARWPHFAATPANLYPMCSTCQGHKGSHTGDPRTFIHPYFDRFSLPQILTLRIFPPFEKPTFELAPSAGLAPDETRLVRDHMLRLKFDERFITFFTVEHRRLLRTVQLLRDAGANVDVNLAANAEGAAFPTRNSWQYVFLAGVVTNPDLMEFLRDGVLPPFL